MTSKASTGPPPPTAAAEETERLPVHAAMEHVPVLWDQNFREYTQGFPLCLQPSHHEWFTAALQGDVQLLQRLEVVDYSLLVVVYEAEKEISFGMIDFFRRYTWDKQVENIGKSLAYMTSGMQPTVLSPGDYQQRFVQTMRGFFAPSLPRQPSVSMAHFNAVRDALSAPHAADLGPPCAAANEAADGVAKGGEAAPVPQQQEQQPVGKQPQRGLGERPSRPPLRGCHPSHSLSIAAYLAGIVRDQQRRDAGEAASVS